MNPASLLERSNLITIIFVIYALVGGIACLLGQIPFDQYGPYLIGFGSVIAAVRGYLAGKRIEKAPVATAQIAGEDDPTTGLTPEEISLAAEPEPPGGEDFPPEAEPQEPISAGPEAPTSSQPASRRRG